MTKLYALIAVVAVLSACSQESSKPASTPTPAPAPAAAPAPAPAPVAPAAAPAPAAPMTAPAAQAPAAVPMASASADLPAECQAYLDKVNACLGKQSGASGEALKTSLEQTRASWSALNADKAQLGAACKASSDAFAAQAAALNC